MRHCKLGVLRSRNRKQHCNATFLETRIAYDSTMKLNKAVLRGDWPTPSAGEYGGSESGGLSGKLCLSE